MVHRRPVRTRAQHRRRCKALPRPSSRMSRSSVSMLMCETMALHRDEAQCRVWRTHQSTSRWPTHWVLTKMKWQDPLLYICILTRRADRQAHRRIPGIRTEPLRVGAGLQIRRHAIVGQRSQHNCHANPSRHACGDCNSRHRTGGRGGGRPPLSPSTALAGGHVPNLPGPW